MKIKLFKSIVIAIMLILFNGVFVTAQPMSGKCGEDVYWELDNNGKLTIYGTGEMYDYDLPTDETINKDGFYIPSKTENLPPWMFKEVTSIEIKEGISSIGSNLFCFNANFDKLVIPEGVTRIGEGAFRGCSIDNACIKLPKSLKYIGNSAFWAVNLNEIVIPDKVEHIGSGAFSGIKCKEIIIPYSVKKIGSEVFCSDYNDKYCNLENVYCVKNSVADNRNLYPDGVNIIYIEKPISIILNGNELSFDESPYIENGVTMVPMRAIFEALGAKVDYNDETSTVTAYKNNSIIKHTIGNEYIEVDNVMIPTFAPSKIVNDCTMVPVRVIAEGIGADVSWDNGSKIVTINYTTPYPDKISEENPFKNYSYELFNILDGRNEKIDAVAWGCSNLTYGLEHIIDVKDETQDIEYGKIVLAKILSKMPETPAYTVDTSGHTFLSNSMSDGVSIATEYFGASGTETKLIEDSIKKLGKVIDWTAFTTEEIDFILKDYKNNIQYLEILKENCDDEYVNDLINSLMTDYTDKWYKTVIDVNEKIADDAIEEGLDAGLGLYTAGLYPLAKYSNELFNNLIGLKGKTDSLADFYIVCRIIEPIDKTYEKCVNDYNNGNCNMSSVQAAFELNKATKIFAYESVEGFASKKDDKNIARQRIDDINKVSFEMGKIITTDGDGKGAMGGR